MPATIVMSSAIPRSWLRAVEDAYGPFRLLSVDVSLAALGGGVMASRLMAARPHGAFFVLLPLSVWAVYTMDHLLDARRMGRMAATPRHQFHRRHFRLLATLCAAAAIVCSILAFAGLSWTGVLFGLGMIALFLGHELLVKLAGNRASPLLMKELGVAAIFTAGTWGLPWMLAMSRDQPLSPSTLLAATQYLLLALANLLEFSIFEQRRDAAAGQTSFVLGVGRRPAAQVVMALLAATVLLGAAGLFISRAPREINAQLIFGAMALGLGWILASPRTFARRERYRTLGDGVFLLPMLMWIA